MYEKNEILLSDILLGNLLAQRRVPVVSLTQIVVGLSYPVKMESP